MARPYMVLLIGRESSLTRKANALFRGIGTAVAAGCVLMGMPALAQEKAKIDDIYNRLLAPRAQIKSMSATTMFHRDGRAPGTTTRATCSSTSSKGRGPWIPKAKHAPPAPVK
jgi:hypothetical protein